MTSNKPKLIIDQQYTNSCIHLMVKITNKTQVRNLLNWLFRFIVIKKNRNILKIDMNDIFKMDKTALFSARLYDKNCQISYLMIDEGKISKRADCFFVITSSKKNFKKITTFDYEKYFELY